MPLTPATTDAFRNIAVLQPGIPDVTTTVAAELVGDTLTIRAGFGITLTADPNDDTITINNTGNGTGAYTEITDVNSNLTFYPLFSRPFAPSDINPLDVPPSYQLDTIYVDNTTDPMTYNPSTGTLSVINLSATSFNMSGHVTIEGVTSTGATGTGNFVFDTSPTLVTPILGTPQSGNFSTGTFTWPTFDQNTTGYSANLAGGNNTTLLGSVHYQSAANVTTQLAPNTTITKKFLTQTGDGTNGAAPAWDTVTATDVGLGNATNESKATMFTDPTFTGTVSGVTATHVGLGNATNESKATMFTDPTFTGTVSGVTATHVGLGNVTNESKATMFTDPTFTGTTTIQQTVEKFSSPSIVANAVTLDFTNGAIFALGSNATNITANFTNVPTTAGQTITVTLIISQGGTAYIPNVVTINAGAQTIKWLANATPSGYANKTDFVSFTFICTATSTYTVIGSLSTYG